VTIDWAAFVVVFIATLLGACGVVALYSFGLRLSDSPSAAWRHAGKACFVVCAAVILYGVYLVIPLFHPTG